MLDHATSVDSTDVEQPDDDRAEGRLLPLGSVAATLVSALVSVLAYGPLPDSVRIHWTLGAGEYYGPEFAPTALVLGLFPVAVALAALVGWSVGATLERVDGFDAVRPLYAAAVLSTLTVLVATQAVVVWANL